MSQEQVDGPSIYFGCACGETFRAAEQHAGRHVQCRCGRVLEVPSRGATRARRETPHAPEAPPSRSTAGPEPFRLTSVHKRWITFVVLAWLGLTVAAIHGRDGNRAERPVRTTRNSARSTAPVGSARPAIPPATLTGLRCVGESRPGNGEELLRHTRSGYGRLTVTNGLSRDAVVVLVRPGGRAFRAMYVHVGATNSMLEVEPGSYSLQFTAGEGWLRGDRRFCRSASYSEFEQPLPFEETETWDGVEYTSWELSLHPVPGGTARADTISDTQFALSSASRP